jgi:hypothetical protein
MLDISPLYNNEGTKINIQKTNKRVKLIFHNKYNYIVNKFIFIYYN